jgi:hypothetical protein
MHDTWRCPRDVALRELADRLALGLNVAAAFRDDQRLTERMRMPDRVGAGLKRHDRARHACRRVALEPSDDARLTREKVRRAVFARLIGGGNDLQLRRARRHRHGDASHQQSCNPMRSLHASLRFDPLSPYAPPAHRISRRIPHATMRNTHECGVGLGQPPQCADTRTGLTWREKTSTTSWPF